MRNWVKAGMLPTARLPGARFHRFDPQDVERLRQQRGKSVSSVERERRTVGPELVDATQLNQWAATRDPQGVFPQLVRRLLASTPGITNISVRSGEGVFASGWDGRAESAGTPYLPSGSLCFEFGVGGRPKVKADEDYEKRRDDPNGAVAAESIFVFATPRRWSGAGAWANERRAEGVFADVQVLDADDLEGWLQATPAVHYWISEQLGRKPQAGETLERWWQRFQARTNPPLPTVLFRAGRDHECEQLRTFLTGPPGVIGVQGPWRDESIVFVCAAIEIDQQDEARTAQPPLIVSASDVWERVIAQPGGMTLLPTFDDPDISSAQAAGHHVVIPFGREQVARSSTIKLPPLDRQETGEALEAAGIQLDRAHHLAALARRSMASLVRTLAQDPRIARPPWSQYPTAGILAPLTLVGAWTPSSADRDVASQMANDPWPTIEHLLLYWRDTEDPPFVRSSGQWHLASADEAFMVLHGSLSSDDLERWHRIATEVLVETDPKLELPAEERPTAGIIGAERQHSSVVRSGIADGIALIGALGTDMLADGVSGAEHARRMVRRILKRAEADDSGRICQSLSAELPLLAEAAPEAFLDAVHDSLDKGPRVLATMFQDGDQSSSLYSSSPHTGLLWALETLCWSPEHLLEATRALARMDVVDPGGRLTNRPLASLQSVLVPWIRHTAASLELRVQAVQQICRQLPDVGWKLLLALWPEHHAISLPPHAPRHRDWEPEKREVAIAEWLENIGHLVTLAITAAGEDPTRWADLAERLDALPPTERKRLLDQLDHAANPDTLSTEQRLLLWERLRKEIARHRVFPTADWSMNDEPLSHMKSIADRLEPADNVERFAYLFDWHPDLPDVDVHDHEAHDKALRSLRKQAVRETIATTSVDGLARLARRSPVPGHLGWVVGDIADDNLAPELLTWLDADDNRRDVAASWASRKTDIAGVTWLVSALTRPESNTPERQLALALSAPPTREVWDALARTSDQLHTTYWEKMTPWRVPPEDAERAAQQLLAHGRPWPAVDLLASHVRREDERPACITPMLVREVLDSAVIADSTAEARMQSIGYEIGLLLDYLESEGIEPDTIARYEWPFFPLLDRHRQPRALFAALGRDASLFVELVCRVYRGKQEQRRQASEEEAALARHSWWVLNHWRQLPGRNEDGTFDVEHLKRWVTDARLQLADADRADIGDEQIGRALSASPPGTDDVWPAEPIREIIETIGSRSLETGIHIGVINSRGVTSRGVYDGGQQERNLASRYRRWAKDTAGEWPRVSRVLRGLAEDYEREAQHADARAQLTADTE